MLQTRATNELRELIQNFLQTEIIEKQGLKQVTDNTVIEAIIDKVITDHPTQVADYRSGKDKLFGFFVGLAMKETKGKANPQQLNELLKKKLQG